MKNSEMFYGLTWDKTVNDQIEIEIKQNCFNFGTSDVTQGKIVTVPEVAGSKDKCLLNNHMYFMLFQAALK